MKIYSWINLLLIVVVFASCTEDEILKPSLSDVDRAKIQLNLDNAIVKKVYDDFNVALLYEYNDTLDFTYVASSAAAAKAWGDIEIPQVLTRFADSTGVMLPDSVALYEMYLNDALTFIDTTLFKYFAPNSFIADKMPEKVLLSEDIYANSEVQGFEGKVSRESEARVGNALEGSLHNVFNNHSIVFKVNQDDVAHDTEEYIKDNCYVFLSRIINKHQLQTLVPEKFYVGKQNYYGQKMDGIFREENNIDEELDLAIIDKDWFYSKGFIDATYFCDIRYGLGTVWEREYDDDGNYVGWIKHYNALEPDYTFVSDEEEDLRSYISELMFRDADELAAFPDNITNNLVIIYDLVSSWGVDLDAINPELIEFRSNN